MSEQNLSDSIGSAIPSQVWGQFMRLRTRHQGPGDGPICGARGSEPSPHSQTNGYQVPAHTNQEHHGVLHLFPSSQ